jgi:hypothetical protein
MPTRAVEIFEDQLLVEKIRRRLPHLFFYAERDSSRAGSVGMEVGSVRERILIALLIYYFGEENIESDIPIIEPEVDVRLFGEPISIKTLTSRSLGGVKLIWTVDWARVQEFCDTYEPTCNYLFSQIIWNDRGGLFLIPLEAQLEVFEEMGRDNYLKPPRQGTNPRGVEISKDALEALVNHAQTRRIEINWQRPVGEYDIYERWVEYWRLD